MSAEAVAQMFRADVLETPPKQSELYFWADYVELRCLTDPDGQFGLDRLIQYVKFAQDLGQMSSDAQDADDSDIEDMLVDPDVLGFGDPEVVDDEDIDTLGTIDLVSDDVEYSDFGRDAELRDDSRRWSEDVFRLLENRASLLGDLYPFTVSEDSFTIEKQESTDERLAYVFYLCCSSLRYFDRQTQSRLTRLFELASGDVLRLLLPSPAIVDVFGTAGGAGTSMFKGSLHARISALAQELRGTVIVEEVDFHPNDSADNGLDLVAWIPMNDAQCGVPSFFAQCACGAGWKGKQSEAAYLQRWHRFISLTSPPVTLTFIPHFFRKAGGHWSADSDVETVLVDRLRALRLYGSEAAERGTVPLDLVRGAWNFKLTPV